MNVRRASLLIPFAVLVLSALGEQAQAAPALTPGVYISQDIKCSDLEWWSAYGNYGEEDAPLWQIDPGHRFQPADRAKVTGAGAFTAGGTRYRLCPDESLKPDVRTWPASQHKRLAGLPIKPGLYRAYSLGKPNDPNAQGCGTTGYVLFEPTRYAWIGYEGNQVERLRGVRQVGPRLFEPNESVPFLILAPDRFFMFEGECDAIEFRPANPRSVPKARMPHW